VNKLVESATLLSLVFLSLFLVTFSSFPEFNISKIQIQIQISNQSKKEEKNIAATIIVFFFFFNNEVFEANTV
jgi:hypothetical protein